MKTRKASLIMFISICLSILGIQNATAQFKHGNKNSGRSMSITNAPELEVYIICDQSGSMRDNSKMEELQDAVEVLLKKIPSDPVLGKKLKLGIVSFASNADLVRNASLVSTSDDIPQFFPDGGTNMTDALEKTNSLIQRHGSGLKPIVILLTDGEPDNHNSALRAADELKNTAHLYALGVSGSDFDYLEEMAGSSQAAALAGTNFRSFFTDMGRDLSAYIMSSGYSMGMNKGFKVHNYSNWKQ